MINFYSVSSPNWTVFNENESGCSLSQTEIIDGKRPHKSANSRPRRQLTSFKVLQQSSKACTSKTWQTGKLKSLHVSIASWENDHKKFQTSSKNTSMHLYHDYWRLHEVPFVYTLETEKIYIIIKHTNSNYSFGHLFQSINIE